MPAYGYETVYPQTGTESAPAQRPSASDEVTLENEYPGGPGGAATGEPLAEALAFNNPLRATLAANDQTQVVLPVQSSLAGVTSATAILRAARTQDGSSTINPSNPWPQPEQVSFVLRVYLASATAGSASPVTITLPFLSPGATFAAEPTRYRICDSGHA